MTWKEKVSQGVKICRHRVRVHFYTWWSNARFETGNEHPTSHHPPHWRTFHYFSGWRKATPKNWFNSFSYGLDITQTNWDIFYTHVWLKDKQSFLLLCMTQFLHWLTCWGMRWVSEIDSWMWIKCLSATIKSGQILAPLCQSHSPPVCPSIGWSFLWLVSSSVRLSVGRSVRRSVHPTLLLLGFRGLWPHCSCYMIKCSQGWCHAKPTEDGWNSSILHVGKLKKIIHHFVA